MSHTIATSIKIDKNGNFSGTGGANNVRPFYTYPFHWDDKEDVMYDILSGCVQIERVKSKTGDKIRGAIKIVKQKHIEKYGQLQESYPYSSKSINPYSIYQIGGTYFSNKRGHKAPAEIDFSNTSEKYWEEMKTEHRIYTEKWNEYAEFYKELLNIFFNHIKSN